MKFTRVIIGFLFFFLAAYPFPRWLSGGTLKELFPFAQNNTLGYFFIVIGLALCAWTTSLFFTIGKGTPVSTDPPSKLVVSGPYRYTRNPMALGFFSILFGEAFLWGSSNALFYLLLVIFFFLFVIIPREERDLEARFGQGYLDYKNRVPRWIPRLTP